MKYKFFVYCPDKKEVINKIIETASKHRAGVYGKYSLDIEFVRILNS